jgi:phage gpG-like protein
MLGLEITMIPNQAILQADFADLGFGIRSLREPLKQAVREVVIPSIEDNFIAEGRPAWEPLSESRSRQKQQQGYPDQILVATGLLERIATQMSIWSFDGGYGSGEAQASVDNLGSADYGFYHQDGTFKMPPRPFLVFQDEDEDEVVQVFEDYIEMRATRAGF